MPHLRKKLPFILLFFATVSCQRQSRIEGIFDLVENQPDSGLVVLKGIDRNTLSGDELAGECWLIVGRWIGQERM